MANVTKEPGFGPEERVLLMLARPHLSYQDVGECRDLLTDHQSTLDWGRVVDLAGRHRVLPLVGANLTNHGLFHSADGKAFLPAENGQDLPNRPLRPLTSRL